MVNARTIGAMATVESTERAPARMPDDPAAFVKYAEHVSNEYDAEGAAGVYSEDVEYEFINDGIQERHLGAPAVREAWKVFLDVARDTGLKIDKTVIAVGDDTITNEWRGLLKDGSSVAGMEYWQFDAEGKVRKHTMFGYSNVLPASNWAQRLRFFAMSPRSAIAYLRAERRHR